MSLSRYALRIAATRALTGATLAEDRVFDSAISPIDEKIKTVRKPLIQVTTDDQTIKPDGRDLVASDGECALVIEVAVAAATRVAAGDGETVVDLVVAETDEGLEAILDLIEFEIRRRLTTPADGWPAVFMDFALRFTNYTSRRGVDDRNGIRFAARQITIMCDVVGDPVPGRPIEEGTAWARFLAVADADPAIAPIASIIRALITDPDAVDWRRQAAEIGITAAGAAGIGIAPYDLTADDDGAILDEVVVDADPDDIVVEPEDG